MKTLPFQLSIPYRILLFSVSFALSGVLALADEGAPQTVASMTQAAKRLMDTLSPAQKKKATMAFNDEERVTWAYIPQDRLGVPLKDLDQRQRNLVHAVLKTVLSAKGHEKAQNIIALESVLFALEGAARRDVELYYLSLFGEPVENGTWGWSFEGHHLSLNFTVVNGKLLATAPHFWGANPAEVREGVDSMIGLRALKNEEDFARELLASLNPKQKTKAVFEEKAFKDIVTKAESKVEPLDLVGISAKELNGDQKAILRKLIRFYIGNMKPEVGNARWEKIVSEGVANIHFGWAGSEQRGEPHYYRIQGPSFLIEYDNVQNGANHIHAVWRDFDGDFGRDLLKEHYRGSSHSH